MKRKKVKSRIKRNIWRSGLGVITAASLAAAVPAVVYASQADSSYEGRIPEEMPGVSDPHEVKGEEKHNPNRGADTIFEVVELDKLYYRITMTVLERVSKEPVSDVTIYFEILNDDGSVGGTVFAGDNIKNSVTGTDGQLTFMLEAGRQHRIHVSTDGTIYEPFKPDQDNKEYYKILNGSQNQGFFIYLDKRPDTPKPTEPSNPVEPEKPSQDGNKGTGGGGTGGGRHTTIGTITAEWPGETETSAESNIETQPESWPEIQEETEKKKGQLDKQLSPSRSLEPSSAADETTQYSDEPSEDQEIPSEDAATYVPGVRFSDCWFHWLELILLLLITMILGKRLIEIQVVNDELDEMEKGDLEEDHGKEK